MEAGGEGPLGLSPGALGNPPPFIIPFEPLDTGGDISCPRGFGEYGELSSSPWYFEIPDHSLPPPIDTGDRGPGPGLRFIVELSLCCQSTGSSLSRDRRRSEYEICNPPLEGRLINRSVVAKSRRQVPDLETLGVDDCS